MDDNYSTLLEIKNIRLSTERILEDIKDLILSNLDDLISNIANRITVENLKTNNKEAVNE